MFTVPWDRQWDKITNRHFYDLLNNLGNYKNPTQFWIDVEGKQSNAIPDSFSLDFSEILVNWFALSHKEENTSWPLSREGIAYLP